MTEQKHTTAPWAISRESDGDIILKSANGHEFASIGCELIDEDNETKANAHLIAAAPELLEALEALVKEIRADIDYGEFSGENMTAFGVALKAIAKARGES